MVVLDKVQVNWKIPVVLLDKVRAEAQSQGYGTITAFVVQVLIDYFTRHKKK